MMNDWLCTVYCVLLIAGQFNGNKPSVGIGMDEVVMVVLVDVKIADDESVVKGNVEDLPAALPELLVRLPVLVTLMTPGVVTALLSLVLVSPMIAALSSCDDDFDLPTTPPITAAATMTAMITDIRMMITSRLLDTRAVVGDDSSFPISFGTA